MAWKSSFRQNYRTTFSPTVPTSAAGISHVIANVEAPGGEKREHLKSGGKQWQATLRTCPGCSIPESYQSPDWALVSAQTGPWTELKKKLIGILVYTCWIISNFLMTISESLTPLQMDRMLECSNLWNTEYTFCYSPKLRKPLCLRLIFMAALSKSYLVNICPMTEFIFGMITRCCIIYEGWNFNSGNYLFTTDTK